LKLKKKHIEDKRRFFEGIEPACQKEVEFEVESSTDSLTDQLKWFSLFLFVLRFSIKKIKRKKRPKTSFKRI
jgi:hypothetical protein